MRLWLKAIGIVLGVLLVAAAIIGGGFLFFSWVGVQWIPAAFGLLVLVMIIIGVHDSLEAEEEEKEEEAVNWWE